MEQGSKRIGIVGAGASGCLCAYFLLKSGITDITLFDYASPLRTILPTGGGRCNLAHAEYDYKELARNYPRGEKFLYSVFSKFSTYNTLSVFDDMGIETYIQDDNRIFPTSNSSKRVRETILSCIKSAGFQRERVIRVEKAGDGFKVNTDKSSYYFSHLIIASGGHSGTDFFGTFHHNIIPGVPSLVGLTCNANIPAGIVLKGVYEKTLKLKGDILFTHFGISGPLTYKISALNAFKSYPYKLVFDFYNNDINLQDLFNKNPHKELKNILSKFLPLNFIKHLLSDYAEIKACNINGKQRDFISDKLHNCELEIHGTNKGEETVTAGGVDLDEIIPKSMQSRKCRNLYFIGEVLNIDGFCGGFNLQNAWSTAYIAAESIINGT